MGYPNNSWGVTIWEASPSDPEITVTVTNPSLGGAVKDCIVSRGYNVLKMPAAAVAPGAADGLMVVYDAANVWEFAKAVKTSDTVWTAYSVRKFARTGTGTLTQYDNCGGAWLCQTSSMLQSVIKKAEIDAGVIEHAIAYGYWGDGKPTHWGDYPCRINVAGISDRTWAHQIGYRFQLDPAYNIDALSVTPATKVVLRAMQDYGIIFTINSGIGSNSLQRESATGKAWSWSGVFSTIPASVINSLRLINQVCASGETGCPNP